MGNPSYETYHLVIRYDNTSGDVTEHTGGLSGPLHDMEQVGTPHGTGQCSATAYAIHAAASADTCVTRTHRSGPSIPKNS